MRDGDGEMTDAPGAAASEAALALRARLREVSDDERYRMLSDDDGDRSGWINLDAEPPPPPDASRVRPVFGLRPESCRRACLTDQKRASFASRYPDVLTRIQEGDS